MEREIGKMKGEETEEKENSEYSWGKEPDGERWSKIFDKKRDRNGKTKDVSKGNNRKLKRERKRIRWRKKQ